MPGKVRRTVAGGTGRADGTRPRPAPNWLTGSDQRRLFLTWMPPALAILLVAGWLERSFLGPVVRPAVPQVDTVLSRAPVTRTVDDAVTIEALPAEAVPGADRAAAGEPVVPRDLLAAVRDDTVFRSADGPAWFAIWGVLAAEGASGSVAPRGREVSFAQLFEQPASYRGRRVRFAGTIRRLQEVEAGPNDRGIERTWQAWVEPADGPRSPIVVYLLSVPPDMPTGMRVDVPVTVDGVFFKRWAYQASDAIRLAPLVMAAAPRRAPRITSGSGTSAIVGWALLSIVGLVAVTGAALALGTGRRPRRGLPDRLPVLPVDADGERGP